MLELNLLKVEGYKALDISLIVSIVKMNNICKSNIYEVDYCSYNSAYNHSRSCRSHTFLTYACVYRIKSKIEFRKNQ